MGAQCSCIGLSSKDKAAYLKQSPFLTQFTDEQIIDLARCFHGELSKHTRTHTYNLPDSCCSSRNAAIAGQPIKDGAELEVM
eukprot:5891-Heterococcus_DN1.PRE.3